MGVEVQCLRHMFQQRTYVHGASLPSTGSARAIVPPLQRYYQGTATSCRPFPPPFVSFVWRYHGNTRHFAPGSPRVTDLGPGVGRPVPLPGFLPWRGQDLPSSWGAPIPVCTCSWTPDGRLVPDLLQDSRMAPRNENGKAPTFSKISRLDSMAFGLAASVSRDGYPPNRARLASRCWSGSPGRASTRKAPTEGF